LKLEATSRGAVELDDLFPAGQTREELQFRQKEAGMGEKLFHPIPDLMKLDNIVLTWFRRVIGMELGWNRDEKGWKTRRTV
jgi:hypothetical protein